MVLKQSTRTDDAFVYIRQKIIEGEIPFGSRLHVVNLAEETGFSPTPIRESLGKLEMYGLAISYPQRGVFVVSPCRRELLEMIDARLCLELHMAKSVIKNATPADINAMRQACEEAAIAASQAHGLLFEEGLHGHYARVAANQFMNHLYMRVMSLLNVLYIQGIRSCQDQTWIHEYRQQHLTEEIGIIDAIEAGDLEGLVQKVEIHIQHFQDYLLTTLEKWPPKGLNW